MLLFLLKIPQDGQKLIQKAKRVKTGEEVKDFVPENVQKVNTVNALMERTFTVVTEKEFERIFGRKHRKKDPTCLQAQLLNPGGVMEPVFLFRDESSPYRKLRIQSSMTEQQLIHLMEKDGQYHAEQGQLVFTKAVETRATNTNVEQLWSSSGVSSIDEYLTKMKKPGPVAQGGQDSKSWQSDEAAAAASVAEAVAPLSTRLGLDGDDDDAVEDAESTAASQKATYLGTGGGVELVPSSKKKPPPPKRKGSVRGSPKDLSGLMEEAAGDDAELATVSSEADAGLADRDLTDEQLVDKYVRKCTIPLAFGQNKNGIQRGFAMKSLRKFTNPGFKQQLAGHIEMWDLARSLRPGDIDGLSDQGYRSAITRLKEIKVQWPADVLLAIWVGR